MAFLLIIAMVPLAVAAVLIDQTAEVAYNFASNESAFLRPPLIKAKSAYLDLIETKRDLYYRQVALRVADQSEVRAAHANSSPAELAAVAARFDAMLAETRELEKLTLKDASGAIVVERDSLSPVGVDSEQWRPIEIEQPLGDTGAALIATFAASTEVQADYVALNRALEDAKRIDEVRSSLPSSYRIAFLMLVGGVVLLVSIAGIVVARRFVRRISALVYGTRRVAAGDLKARVDLSGRDELAELAWAFNGMVEDLEHDRDQIAYLQRIGAWQDVARKLAHEIKNPLTPIQLAVQQTVSSYKGDDDRFKRLLGDTEEIVTEEISSLRRLVDAFRTLGQLPRVDAKPLDLGGVVDDLTRDPMLIDQLALHPPERQVMIRGDRLLLRRVLTNLVENGIHAGQAADRDGKVVIRWSADDAAGRVLVTVDDEGAGVPADRREKIFEPYITNKETGTGLGLTISKKIALEHGGALTLAPDRAPTGGARFMLTLPLAEADNDDATADS